MKLKIVEFVKELLAKVKENDSIAYAYQLTYSLLLSLFPFLIFLFTLVPYMNLDSAEILLILEQNLPNEVYDLVAGIVVDVVDMQRGGLMSLSVVLAVYSASAGFRAFMKGTNRAMGIHDHRNIVVKYILSISLVVLFAVSILLSLLGIVFGGQIIAAVTHYFPQIPLEGTINVLRLLLPVLLIFLLLSAFYVIIPNRKMTFTGAFPGAAFATVSWVVFTLVFQYYVDNFSNYSRFYGTLGAVVALMLWLLLTSIIMIFGAEINAIVLERRERREKVTALKKEGGRPESAAK